MVILFTSLFRRFAFVRRLPLSRSGRSPIIVSHSAIVRCVDFPRRGYFYQPDRFAVWICLAWSCLMGFRGENLPGTVGVDCLFYEKRETRVIVHRAIGFSLRLVTDTSISMHREIL